MDEKDKKNGTKTEYVKPEGAKSLQSISIAGNMLDYEVDADWLILRKDEKPRAEMFYVRYSLITEDEKPRPLTFVFNGGPGASSVYLHMGALGPRRVELTEHGEPTPPPARLIDNEESWLTFSDLVFIDPIGTGLSRIIEDPEAEKKDEDKTEYWKLKRDLESLSEFMRKFLTVFRRWESPVYITGESYGGFRVGKLAKMLQKEYGVGLAGAVIISPALEFTLLNGSDYDVLPWIDVFPTMAGAAAFHGLSRKIKKTESLEDLRSRAAEFAVNELMPVMASGELIPAVRRTRTLNAAADFLGFDRALVNRNNGRISIEFFVKNLLRSDRRLLGLYDASRTVADPYPDRDNLDGPDPTLHVLERVFAAGINAQLGAVVGLKTDRDYNLLSTKVNESWDDDTRKHALETQVGATDDLRYGMSLNPDMKVYITHGTYDLVTPFFSTDRIAALMKLSPELKKNLKIRHYPGGHMFYTWEESRKEFFEEMKEFYK